MYVPASASDAVVKGSAKFRSKGRLPALSYFYAPKKVSTVLSKIEVMSFPVCADVTVSLQPAARRADEEVS